MFKSSSIVALALFLQGCDAACILPPCALPIALEVNVSSALLAGPVSGASLSITGAATSTVSCESTCLIPGQAGTYRLTLSAPGYSPKQATVVVPGTSPPCGCPTVETERVSFVLAG